MPNIVLLKDNKVVTIAFNVDANGVVLNDEAKVGEVYNPETGLFSKDPELLAREKAAEDALAADILAAEQRAAEEQQPQEGQPA